MLNRNAAGSGLLMAAMVLAGACADIPPTKPLAFDEPVSLFARAPDNRSSFTGTLDHEFVRLAREIPGFGGIFYDESGALNVVMAPVVAPMASAELRQGLAARLEAMGQPAGAAQGVRVREGKYDFLQLFEMRQRVDQAVWGLQGIVFTDADEAANRVAIGVEDASAAASVERAVAMLGLPREAVILRQTAPLRFTDEGGTVGTLSGHTLQDLVRPVAGGLGIWSDGLSDDCALGFNVRSPEAPNVHGFVIHSLCTTHPYSSGPVGTSYWQPHPGWADSFIGTEVHDAPPFTGGACPPNPSPSWLGCRWSSAAGARYAPGVPNAFGRIYRTTGVNTGSIVIDLEHPTFEIVDELPFAVLGQVVHKVGQYTGWTQATVDATCVTLVVGFGGNGLTNAVTFLCLQRATQAIDFGVVDEGPVFVRAGEHEAHLLGLVTLGIGDSYLFSPMAQIRLENPPPPGRTWRTFPPPTP
jgi:hypothetical protein